ncbi:cation diffusion facilitator family transporter [Auraticoccus sp. F435]|uniref:Cation diffusion facilitator family transporter n=1 Tax=Auraticoccus cholistanensis TaxID=2656650 RepID=A0A6A9V216_9ACTN|nr:cation diffusion facilitator family transporter [Auraticoccus cholistanensis]MVA77645.1 cation diffusion facilitator family transporter [Auraticoccus cholistanensis]
MGAGHTHGPPGHAGGRHRGRLALALVLAAGFWVVEAVTGVLTGSLALLSDAGHMAGDVLVLAVALVATRIATRTDRSGRRSFGSYRVEVFASGLAVLVMLGVAVAIAVEAVGRIGHPPPLAASPVLAVGVLVLAVNVVALLLLRAGARESLNVKGAYLEVAADAVGSVGVVVAGALVLLTGDPRWDVGIGLALAVFVAVRAVLLAREVLSVLAQHTPAGLDPEEVRTALAALPGVVDVHDLHLWTLTSGMDVATVHLVAAAGADTHAVLDAAGELMRDRFGVEHATVQIDPVDHSGCQQLRW